MADSIRVNSQTINIVAGDKLRPGDVISARITDILPGNRFRILWKGRTLTAESQIHLLRGQLIRARVEQNTRGTTLRLINSAHAGSPSLGGAAQSSSQLLSSAFLKASMAVPADSVLDRMSALLGRSRGNRTRLARLYADLVSRGTDPTADFIEALDGLLSGRDEGESRQHGSKDPRGWNEPPDADRLASDMKGRGEDGEALLELLNRSVSGDDSWFFHTGKRRLGDDELGLSWKLRSGHRPALALTVRDGERILEFLLDGKNPLRMEVYIDEKTFISSKSWDKFRQRLALMNVEVGDTILSMETSDGFSPGPTDHSVNPGDTP